MSLGELWGGNKECKLDCILHVSASYLYLSVRSDLSDRSLRESSRRPGSGTTVTKETSRKFYCFLPFSTMLQYLPEIQCEKLANIHVTMRLTQQLLSKTQPCICTGWFCVVRVLCAALKEMFVDVCLSLGLLAGGKDYVRV